MNIALILSGGTGTRLGSALPKQYIEVGSKRIISYCLETFDAHEMIDCIQIVAAPEYRSLIDLTSEKIRGFSDSGETRQLSILSGLNDIMRYASDDDIVIIHDAARPLVTSELITACLEAAREHDGAVPVLPARDTMYLSEDGMRVTALTDRSKLFSGQAPEAFRLGKYLAANLALPDELKRMINGSAEPAVLAGMDIVMIDGDERNFKITTAHDLERFVKGEY